MNFEKNFLGKDGFVWFFGIVENRMDPLRNSRVQVRCLGYHTADKQKLPTEDLFWSQVATSTDSASVSGIGENSSLKEGSFVFGFFMDGTDCQHPMILASIPTIPLFAPNPQQGFNDPRTDTSNFPKVVESTTESRDGSGTSITSSNKGKTYPNTLDQPDVNQLQRNDEEPLEVTRKNSNRVLSISTANGSTFDQPKSPYNTTYPFNQVKQTESGHVLELDDTPGQERVHLMHRVGSFLEYGPDGSLVDKVVNDRYSFTVKSSYEHVENKKVVTVDKGMELLVNRDGESNNLSIKVGQGGSYEITIVQGDVIMNVSDGNVTKYINGDLTEEVTGNVNRTVGGNITETVGGNVTENVTGNTTEVAGGNKVIIGATVNIN